MHSTGRNIHRGASTKLKFFSLSSMSEEMQGFRFFLLLFFKAVGYEQVEDRESFIKAGI